MKNTNRAESAFQRLLPAKLHNTPAICARIDWQSFLPPKFGKIKPMKLTWMPFCLSLSGSDPLVKGIKAETRPLKLKLGWILSKSLSDKVWEMLNKPWLWWETKRMWFLTYRSQYWLWFTLIFCNKLGKWFHLNFFNPLITPIWQLHLHQQLVGDPNVKSRWILTQFYFSPRIPRVKFFDMKNLNKRINFIISELG